MALKLSIAQVPNRGRATAALDGDALAAVVVLDRDGVARVLDSAFDEATAGAEGLHRLVNNAERSHWDSDNATRALVRCLGHDDFAALRKAVAGKSRGARLRAEIRAVVS